MAQDVEAASVTCLVINNKHFVTYSCLLWQNTNATYVPLVQKC